MSTTKISDARRVFCKRHEIHYPETKQCPWREEKVVFSKTPGVLQQAEIVVDTSDLKTHGVLKSNQTDDTSDEVKNKNPYNLSDEEMKQLDEYAKGLFGV